MRPEIMVDGTPGLLDASGAKTQTDSLLSEAVLNSNSTASNSTASCRFGFSHRCAALDVLSLAHPHCEKTGYTRRAARQFCRSQINLNCL